MMSWLGRYALGVAALGVAALLKLHYSQATPEALRWILAPTASMSELVLQRELVFRAGEGYLSRELSILISPACAGVSFMIVALLSLVLAFGQQAQGGRGRVLWLAQSLAIAYGVTILVNVLRIALSVALGHWAASALGLTFQSVHRLLGVAVYLAGLLATCLTVRFWLSSRAAASPPAPAERGQRLPGWRAVVLLALGCYAAVTLLLPLLRGAGASPDYWAHAGPVSVLVVVSGALLFAAGGRTWDDGRHAIRSPEHPQRVAPEPRAG